MPKVSFCASTHKLLTTGAVSLIMFTTGAGAVVPVPTDVVRVPIVDNPDPLLRDVPFLAWHEDLSAVGYVEREIFYSGTANEYEYIDDAGQSPLVQVKPGTQGEYTTRMIVRRPNKLKNFNGVVYLEILNATAGYDGSPHWNLTYESIIADGAAYVGITYDDNTVSFLSDLVNGWGAPHTDYTGCPDRTDPHPAPCGSQARNNSRYLEEDGITPVLNIPTRAYTWDMLNQAAALIRDIDNRKNPFFSFEVEAIIAMGYSQSARYVTTFGNSFYPSYSELDCTPEQEELGECTTPLVNGFIVAAGSATSSKPDGVDFHRVPDRRNCENALNREAPCVETEVEPSATETPLELAKFMRYTTESDIRSIRVRQDVGVANVADYDQPDLRTYEAAGTSHVDFWGRVVGGKVAEYNFGIPANPNPQSGCDLPDMNPIRTGIPLSAIQHRMGRWIKFNELPPSNRFMEWTGDFSQTNQVSLQPDVEWIRDADGNAINGVRPARIEVPLGKYLGSNSLVDGPLSSQKIFCYSIIGGFEEFSQQEIEARYTNRATFAAWTWWSAYMSYLDGFLLPVDAKTIMDEAKAYEGLPE